METMTADTSPPGDVDSVAERWQMAASYLQPEKSVERIVASAKYVIASVMVVATVLTAVGSLRAEEIAQHPLSKWLAASTGVVVTGAILLAYLPLIIKTKNVQVENLVEVERWFEDEIKKGRFVRLAGISLGLAMVLAVITAVAATAGIREAELAVTLTESGLGVQQKLIVTVAISSPSQQDPLTVSVTGMRGSERLLLLQSTHSEVLTGETAVLSQTVEGVQGFACFVAEVRYGHRASRQSLGCLP
jgi:hypothetical protein